MARTSRVIKVKSGELSNNNLKAQVGTVEQRDAPQTIYVSMGFWTRPTKDSADPRGDLKREIDICYRDVVRRCLKESSVFTREDDNIFIVNMPNNFNYNDKRNYINIELYLHTSNIDGGTSIPLSTRKGNPLYKAALDVLETFVSSELMMEKRGFEVKKTNQ